MKHLNFLVILVSVAVLASLSACSARPPFQPIAQAYTQIARAQMAKADVYANPEFTMSQDLVNRAEKALYNYDYKLAEDYAEEAAAMADLSYTKTQWLACNSKLKDSEQDLALINQTLMQIAPTQTAKTETVPMGLQVTPQVPTQESRYFNKQ